MRRITGVLIVLAVTVGVPTAAQASFPGANGKIAYVSGGDIWTMNPDGSAQLNLTNDAAVQGSPSWSPDGARIVYEETGAIWQMRADGTGRVFVNTPPNGGRDPAWSPDGTKIVLTNGG